MLAKTNFIHDLRSELSDGLETATPPEVPYLQFPRLSTFDQVAHAVYTRLGGVSTSVFRSLNASYSTGDEKEKVTLNLRIIKEVIGAKDLRYMNQAHGTSILLFRDADPAQPETPPTADAMITDMPGVALMVKQADCQAVLFLDPEKGVIANAHCGWRGNTQNLLGTVVNRMQEDFACRPSDIRAAIGPSLGPCCAEFVTYEEIFPESFKRFMGRRNYFDLWEVSRAQLLDAGLNRENIELAGICTRCRTDLFYSYRGEGVTGRFATVIMLRGDEKAAQAG